MAVVVWVFAGGGDSEVGRPIKKLSRSDKDLFGGLIKFLNKNFPGCQFIRKTPIRQKPGPKPNKKTSYGKTGQSLIEQIKEELPIALRNEPNKCDLILVFDDLDCRDPQTQKEKILEEIAQIPGCGNIEKFVGFAAPELEAWIIADWGNTLAKHPDFGGKHEGMREWLSREKDVPFKNPESFSEYDPEKDACKEKLSALLIESSEKFVGERFSKGWHTAQMLLEVNCNELQRKCPLFRELYNYLNYLCQTL